MITLTAGGSFADAYCEQFEANVISSRGLTDNELDEVFSKSDTVIHNASVINGNDIDYMLSSNFDLTRRIVQSLQRCNPSANLVLLSSMSILDTDDSTRYGDVSRMTPYAYSKFLAETYCLKSDQLIVSSVRFSTLFYSDPDKDILSKLISDAVAKNEITIYDGGLARRNFLPISVAAQYVNQLVSPYKPRKSSTYTFCGPNSSSFIEIADMLSRLLPTLTVKNVESTHSLSPVLSEFVETTPPHIQPIAFDLEAYIRKYIRDIGA